MNFFIDVKILKLIYIEKQLLKIQLKKNIDFLMKEMKKMKMKNMKIMMIKFLYFILKNRIYKIKIFHIIK